MATASTPSPLALLGARVRRAHVWAPRSLRWRLAAWVAGVMLVSSAIVFVVVYINTGTQIERQIDTDIAGDTAQLGQSLRGLRNPSADVVAATARRYVSGQPYDVTSTVFLVLIRGRPVISNQPEVLRRANAELLTPHLGFHSQPIPGVGRLRILERAVRVGASTLVIGAGEPLAAVSRAQRGVAQAFVLAGVLSLLLALIASYFAGARVTAPLRRLASVAARVNGGDLQPRMDSDPGAGEELRVLADAFNRMLDRLSEAFAGQRAFVADASHELRTPMTVIRGQLELLAANAAPSAQEIARVECMVSSEINRVGRLVDDMLLLAQADQQDFLRPQSFPLAPFLTDLWDGLGLTAERRFELGDLPAGELTADPDRLAQALRNLARNAIEHTDAPDGLVRLDVTVRAADVRFSITDDGTGIPTAQRELVFDRFHRVYDMPARPRSSARGGAGLGLAIVRAIAEAHGGSVRADAAASGHGTRVELTLPGYAR